MTNLVDVNATLLEQVAEYANHLAARDSDIAILTKTIVNLQVEVNNPKVKYQATPKKTPQHPTVKKEWTHTNWWSASYCYTHGRGGHGVKDCLSKTSGHKDTATVFNRMEGSNIGPPQDMVWLGSDIV